MKKHHIMIPLLINQFNISRDFSLQLSKCLADSDLVVIGLTGIGPIRKISVLNWFLPYWPNESFLYYIDRFDHINANKSKLINNVFYYQYLHIRTSSVWCGFLLNLNCMLYSTIFFAEWISNGRCMFYSTIFFAEWRSNGRFTDEI